MLVLLHAPPHPPRIMPKSPAHPAPVTLRTPSPHLIPQHLDPSTTPTRSFQPQLTDQGAYSALPAATNGSTKPILALTRSPLQVGPGTRSFHSLAAQDLVRAHQRANIASPLNPTPTREPKSFLHSNLDALEGSTGYWDPSPKTHG